MTERYSEPPPRGRRMTTGEFRATPDISASTAQFKAFAAEQGDQTRQWEAPGRNPTRLALLILAVVVVVAIIAILAVTLG